LAQLAGARRGRRSGRHGQATVSEEDELIAEIAWVIGTAHQGKGYAREAAGVLVTWL